MKFQVVKAPGLSKETIAQSQIEIPLNHRPDSCLVIGRFPNNGLDINTRPGNTDKLLSRRHLRIIVRESDLLVCNLGSLTGTVLNGKYHLPRHRWVKVKPEDTLQLGATYLRLVLGSTATTPFFRSSVDDFLFVEELELANKAVEIYQPGASKKPANSRSSQAQEKQPETGFNKSSQLIVENTGRESSTVILPELSPSPAGLAPSGNETAKISSGTESDLKEVFQWLSENPLQNIQETGILDLPDLSQTSAGPTPARNEINNITSETETHFETHFNEVFERLSEKPVQDVPVISAEPVQVQEVPTLRLKRLKDILEPKWKPVLDIPKPVLDIPEPVLDVLEPVADIPVPTQDVSEPVLDVSEPVLDVSEPVLDVPVPVLDVPVPVAEVPVPVLDVPVPVRDIPKTRTKPVWKVPALPKFSYFSLWLKPPQEKAAQAQNQDDLVLKNMVASLVELPPLETEPEPEPLLPTETNLSRGARLENRIRAVLLARQIFWVYLALIGVAELLTALAVVQIGLPLHAIILVMLLLQSAIDPDKSRRQLALALILAPLIRLLSLSLPLLNFNQLIWYPLVAIPLLLTCWLIVQNTGIQWKSLGLSWGNVPLQLMFSLGGVGLGVIEYNILQPRPLFGAISWEILIFGGLNLLFFTGLNEEIIFRGVLQKLAEPVLKDKGLLFLALLFAVLHMGYLSILDLFFVFVVGFVFAYIVRWGGSLLGVVIAHGLTNTTMFLVMPYVAQYPQDPWSQLMPWVLGITTLLSGWGLVRLIWRRSGFKQLLLPKLVQKELKELKN